MSLSEATHVKGAVIGGGIVGLLTALELKKRFPQDDVLLLEQAPFLADHSTGRNSGVLHSGLYYDTGSHKHLLCMEGLAHWKRLIERYRLPHNWCGKVIFATSVSELPRLEELRVRAHENGVPSHLATTTELNSARQHVHAQEALVIESTGILDVSSAMAAARQEFESLGGIVQTSTPALKIAKTATGFHIQTPEYAVEAELLINAAGLWAPDIRAQLGLTELTSEWVKGHYLRSSQKLDYPTLYYPIPPADLKGLGVHSTIDCEGSVKFGPDTLDVTSVDYSLENFHSENMRRSIEKSFVGVDVQRLAPDYAGIRSKIRLNGKLHKDFWLKGPSHHQIPGYAEACGIESPGMTASPAIARRLVQEVSA